MQDKNILPLTPTDSNMIAHMIRECGKAHRLDDAFNIIERQRNETTLVPDVIVMSSLLTACGRVPPHFITNH